MADVRILIVEDENIVAEEVRLRLKNLGYTIAAIASSGEEAIEKVIATHPDLVLMDIQLQEEMDGVDVAEHIHAHFDIPIIYLTSYSDNDTFQRAKIAEPFGYIIKPFEERELHSAIEVALYRDKMEKKLRESEQWFSATLTSIRDAVIATNKEREIVFMNPVAETLTGWKQEEASGKIVTKIFTAINEENQLPIDPDMLSLREKIALLTARNGTETPVEWSSAPISSDHGDVTGSVLIFRDITERKRAEEALVEERALLTERVREQTIELREANAELAHAARLKDEFLANMSHELRTPLNTILGMSEALQEEVYGTLNDKQVGALRHIEEGGRHLLALINDILDLSKIGAGKMELSITPINVEALCQASLRFLNQAAHKKRLKISTMFDSTVITIRADERRMKQVLVNLLSNAVKFTPEGGRIGLDVEGDFEEHVVRFTVWDTGIGIVNKDIERLFQPFIQLDATLSRKYEGAGLGLSLVYHIVDMHGGSISVNSEEGKGSRFTVSLPWEEERWGDGEIGRLGDRETGRWSDGVME
jgi:PAS domain S-box-containing protein